MTLRLLFLSALVLALGGCQLIFGDDGGNGDDCTGSHFLPVPQLRDPSDGTCTAAGQSCGRPIPDVATPMAYRDWATCGDACEQLDEATCVASEGCRAAYATNGTDGIIDGGRQFLGCWGIAPSGPVHGSCDNLDAQACSEHDDCSAIYLYGVAPPPGQLPDHHRFGECVPETCPLTQAGSPLALRDPTTGACVDSGPSCSGIEPPQLDWATCDACAGNDEVTCKSAAACRAIYQQGPGPGAIQYVGCWGVAPSGPVEGGGCDGLDAQACSRHDDCSALYGSDPQGFIACEDEWNPAPACADVTSEATCIDLADGCLQSGGCNQVCTTLYAGSNCACSGGSCTCQTWNFAACTAAPEATRVTPCGGGRMCSCAPVNGNGNIECIGR